MDLRRLVATRLLDAIAADADTLPMPASLAAQRRRQRARVADLVITTRLRRWARALVDVELQWAAGGRMRVDADAAQRMERRLATLVSAARGGPRVALGVLERALPGHVRKATELVRTRPALASVPASASLDAATNETPEEPPLTHQWLPPIVLRICESVERAGARGHCLPGLVAAMRRMRAAVHAANPYGFLHILYQPPPVAQLQQPHSPAWYVPGTAVVREVVGLVRRDVHELEGHLRWMDDVGATTPTLFWKRFLRIHYVVRRLAVGVHHVFLFLYAVAMGRADPLDPGAPGTVLGAIHEAVHVLDRGTLATTGYGLWPGASGRLVREGLRLYPELVVFGSHWRHETDLHEHGFAPDERAADYDVFFSSWRTSRTWAGIARHGRRGLRAWRDATLPAADFAGLPFPALGDVERELKYRLGAMIDLFYRHHAAKWWQARADPAQFQALRDESMLQPLVVTNFSTYAANLSSAPTGPATMAPAPTPRHRGNWECYVRQRHTPRPSPSPSPSPPPPPLPQDNESTISFRSPQRTRRRRRKLDPSPQQPKQERRTASPSGRQERALSGAWEEITEETILRWDDSEIDDHEQETARVLELQEQVLTTRERLGLAPLLRGPEGPEHDGDDDITPKHIRGDFARAVDGQTLISGLCAFGRVLARLSEQAVAAGHEIALHSAAEMLIQRPSMRVSETAAASDDDDDGVTKSATTTDTRCHTDIGDNDAVREMREVLVEATTSLEAFARRLEPTRLPSAEIVATIAEDTQSLLAIAMQLIPRPVEP